MKLLNKCILSSLILLLSLASYSQDKFILSGKIAAASEEVNLSIHIKISDSNLETQAGAYGSFKLNLNETDFGKDLVFYTDVNSPLKLTLKNETKQVVQLGEFIIYLYITKDFGVEGMADQDGDGVPDSYDYCPDVTGSMENNGCPGDRIPVGSEGPPSPMIRFKSFPIPYPLPSDSYTIPWNKIAIIGTKNFTSVDAKLTRALNACGYKKRSYYYIPNGFALVTKIEKINPDGTCITGDKRWSITVDKPDDFVGYLKSLIDAPKGYFRIIVFLVTDMDLSASDDENMTREEGIEYADKGYTSLPNPIKSYHFTANHKVTVLIYEYQKKQGSTESDLLKDIPAQTHLDRAGLTRALR